MPFGKYNDFKDCVNRNKNVDDPAAYCAEIEKRIKGKNMSDKTKIKLRAPFMNVSLSENQPDNSRVYFEGVALKPGKWNVYYYPKDEIANSASGLEGVTVRADHSENVRDLLGRVEKCWMDGELLRYRAWVDYDEGIKKRMRDGVITDNSVGISVTPVMNRDAKQLEAHDIKYRELSLVTDGACPSSAGCGIGLSENTNEQLDEILNIIETSETPDYMKICELLEPHLSESRSEIFANCLIVRTDLNKDEPKSVYRNMFTLLKQAHTIGLELDEETYQALWYYFATLDTIIPDWNDEIDNLLWVLELIDNESLFTICEQKYIIGGNTGTRYAKGYGGCVEAKQNCAGLSEEEAKNLCTMIFYRNPSWKGKGS